MQTLPHTLVIPQETLCACDAALQLLPKAARFGSRGLLVHGKSLKRSGALNAILENTPDGASCACWEHPGGEPTLAQLTNLLATARAHRAEWIAAVGGGSILDIAKGCAGLFHLPEPIQHYHDGAPLDAPALPFITAPTTAGTGSEATPVAVLTNTETGVKKSFRSEGMTARTVILDPKLLTGCPASVVASSGLDALTQAIESYSSKHATWFSQAMALKGLKLLAENLPSAHDGALDGAVPVDAAEGILLGSYLAGVGFASSRLGVVHGLAHPLGARFHQPHGLTCGVCLPYAIRLNRSAMGERYLAMCNAIGDDLLEFIDGLLARFGIKNPFSGQTLADKEAVIEEVLVSGSTKANPLTITAVHVDALLNQILV